MYYKTFTLGHQRHTVVMSQYMSNEEFESYLFYTRRLMGYIVYPRWYAARAFLAECIEMTRRKGIYKHKVKSVTKQLLKTMDSLERIHTTDFDKEFVEVVAGHMAGVALPKINSLKGHIGGVLMNNNLKNYLYYQYPETFLVLAKDNIRCWNQVIDEVKERHGLNFKEVFLPLKGIEVMEVGRHWLSVIETAVGENIPYGINAKGSVAESVLRSLDGAMIDYKHLKSAFLDGYNELPKEKQKQTEAFMSRLQGTEDAAEKLSEKYKVTKL